MSKQQEKKLHPESLMMSLGYKPELSEGALKCPIFQTSTFVFKSAEEGKKHFELAYGLREPEPGEEPGLIYTRLNNPDLEILESRLSVWDEAESSAVFKSGMAAISTIAFEFLKPGDVVVIFEPAYGGTEFLVHNILPKFGIEHISIPTGADLKTIENKVELSGKKENIKLLYLETPANPTNKLTDIQLVADYAHNLSTDILVAVDNTFLGPLWQKPLRFGADLVIYSATKYIGGHSDLIGGVCSGRSELIQRLKVMRTFLGNSSGPWTGWLMMRSLETLKVRMTEQTKNAAVVADFLKSHPKVDRVIYLDQLEKGSIQRLIFEKQCLAPGAMITFDIKGGEKEAFLFLDSLNLIYLAVSLGGTESLIEHPATMTHSDIPKDEQIKMGITEQMIRLSIGLENPEDLIDDLEQALNKI